MRRQLTEMVRRASTTTQEFAAAWDAFWFRPADPTLLGVLRILSGLMLVYTHAVWGLALEQFFGPDGWLSPSFVRLVQEDMSTYSFWWAVPAGWIWPAYGIWMALLVLYTLGLWTRVTSIGALAVVISFAHRVPQATFGLDQINAMLTLYLAIGGAGQALSLDRLIAVRRGLAPARPAPSMRANLGLRLINVHMCVIYFFAGISKLQGESWWTGEAMWRAFANYEYQSLDMTWVAWHPWLLNLSAHTSVLWEVLFCTLIWRPRLRTPMLALGVLLHVGIGACLGMWTFGLIMLVGCASFLPPDRVAGLVGAIVRSRRVGPLASRVLPATSARPAVGWPGSQESPEPVLQGEVAW